MRGMNRKQPQNRSTQAAQPPPALAERMRLGCFVGLLAIFVARSFTPGDSIASLGDGLPAVMLTLVLLCLYIGSLLLGQGQKIRFGPVDTAVVVLFAIEVLAAALGAQHGEPRAAINVLWELVAMAAIFLLARQLFRAGDMRAVFCVMIAAAMAQSTYGLYQYFVSMPADRAFYLEDPETSLRMANVDAPAGSAVRQLYEQRLMSTEPMGRFDLANSLAGFLATWLVVLVVGALVDTGKKARTWIGAALVAAPITVCLLLTKSRSAVLAVAASLVCGVVFVRWGSHWASRRVQLISLGTATGILLLVGVLWALGGVDAEVLSEAPKSLGYRLQYWQSSLAMVADMPWLGCGGGNFQDYYTLYKLPTASEEIADPHNFVFDVWANSGTLALVALALVMGSLVGITWTGTRRAPSSDVPDEVEPRTLRFLLTTTVAGFVLAFIFGLLGEVPLSPVTFIATTGVACAGVFLLRPWTAVQGNSVALPVVGFIAMLVNLSAAGGFHFAGVAGTLWLLVAMAVTVGEDPTQGLEPPRPALFAGLAVSLLLLLGCFYTAYQPVLQSRLLMQRTMQRGLSYEEQVQLLREAAEADQLNPKPWWALGTMTVRRMQSVAFKPEDLDQLTVYAKGFMARDPISSMACLQVGNWYWGIYETTQNEDALQRATEAYRQCVALYPNDAYRRAKLALALEAAQQPQDAAPHREAALELDQVTPHLDKKLPEALRAKLIKHGASQN